MRKTTVYLTDEEAEGLRQLAASTGQSQAQLIRDGVTHILSGSQQRIFHSLGRGEGTGRPTDRWDADNLRRKVLGQD